MLLVLLSIFFALLLLYDQKQRTKYAHIPGPSGLPILGNCIDVVAKHDDKCLEWAEKYGPIFKYKFLFWYVVVVAESKAVKHLVVTNEKNYTKDNFYYKFAEFLLGESIVTIVDDTKHKKMRTILAEAFTYRSLRSYYPVFSSTAKRLGEKWWQEIKLAQEKGAFEFRSDILHDCSLLTVDIIGRVAFATDFNCLQPALRGDKFSGGNRLYHAANELSKSGSRMDMAIIPVLRYFSPSYKKQQTAFREITEELKAIISQKRANSDKDTDQKDFLDVLLGVNDCGEELELHTIVEQCIIFLVAGFETTAAALQWIFALLANNPKIQEKLAVELTSNLETKGASMESVDSLPYLNCVIKEALRLFPPISFRFRQCDQSDTLAEVHIPAQTTIEVSVFAVQNLNSNWENAREFIPERWLGSEEDEKAVNQGAYLPFFHGSRNCIGNRFAMLEMKEVLATIIPQFSFSFPLGSSFPAKVYSMPTLRGSPSIELVISPRK